MSLKKGCSGATLLELLIATVMVAIIVVTTSLVFPKAAKSITNNRQRSLAATFANSRMQELKAIPYGLIDPTPATTAADFPASGIGEPNGCDCRQEDVSAIPASEVSNYTEDGITYTRKVCINLVERVAGAWVTHCPNNPLDSSRDKGLKNIRIKVQWAPGSGQTYSTEMEGLVNR